jgi:hypothetical protein
MPSVDASPPQRPIGSRPRPDVVASEPGRRQLRHRGRRRALFAGGGTILGALIGVVGWLVIDRADTRVGAIAIVALALAGMFGGTVIASLIVVAVEDGEDQRLAEHALETADQTAPRDETDADDGTGRAVSAGDVRTEDPSVSDPPPL